MGILMLNLKDLVNWAYQAKHSCTVQVVHFASTDDKT